MNDLTTLFIFSVYDGNESTRFNAMRHETIVDELRANGYAPEELIGRYEGEDEESIGLRGFGDIEALVLDYCLKFNQTSYLVVHSDKTAELVYPKQNRRIKLGQWRMVSLNEAKKVQGLTIDSKGRYWIAS